MQYYGKCEIFSISKIFITWLDRVRDRLRSLEPGRRLRGLRGWIEADTRAAIEVAIRAEAAIIRSQQIRIDSQPRRLARAKGRDAGRPGQSPLPSAK